MERQCQAGDNDQDPSGAQGGGSRLEIPPDGGYCDAKAHLLSVLDVGFRCTNPS